MAREGRAPSTLATSSNDISIGNGLGHHRVSDIQRSRILSAMAEVACERGAANVTVARMVERAGVSRRTFYEIFEDREDCFLATLEEAIARAGLYVSAEYEPTAAWSERVRGGLTGLLRFLEDEPALGRLAVVESLGAGGKAREMRQEVLIRLVAAVDAGRSGEGGASATTRLTAEGVVGGASWVIYGHLISGDPARLVELLNPLMSMIVLPYLGQGAARREIERPVAKSLASARVPGNPLKGLDMRLTHRTVMVLVAVARNPGRSNRFIGDASGVGDQGQISKLLARLERLGLVENPHADAPKGAPNAWVLTERGEGVANVVGTQATHS
jgi:AcrR family transcriptional regulator